MMKFIKNCLTFIAILVLLLIFAAGTLFYFLTRSPEGKVETTPVPVTAEAAQRLESKVESFIEQLDQAGKTGEQRRVTIEITEEELNSFIARELPRLQKEVDFPFEVESVWVSLREGQARVTAQVNIAGFTPKLSATVGINVEDGVLKVDLKEIDLGRLPLPGLLKEQIDRFLQEGVDLSQMDLPFELRKVVIKDGKLIVEGVSKGSE